MNENDWLDSQVEAWYDEIDAALSGCVHATLDDFDITEFINWNAVESTLYKKARLKRKQLIEEADCEAYYTAKLDKQ